MRTMAAVGTFQYMSSCEYGMSHAASKVTDAIYLIGESGQERPWGIKLICSAARAIHISGQPASVEIALAVTTPTNFRDALIPETPRAIQLSTPMTGMRRKNAAGNASINIGTPAFARITDACTL
jgi:hypothetical protein